MTLRKATILFICLGTLALVCVISLATRFTINASFNGLERDHCGCREFQGSLFSRPVPALDMQALLEHASPFNAV